MGRTINTILPVLMAGMIAVSALGSYGCAKRRLQETLVARK